MTRTARSSFPRAIVRDRSESKSGLDKSLRKNGAGMHNWGSLAQESYYEAAAQDDEEREFLHSDDASIAESISSQSDCMWHCSNYHLLIHRKIYTALEDKKPVFDKSNGSLTDEELETARKFRKNALKTTSM